MKADLSRENYRFFQEILGILKWGCIFMKTWRKMGFFCMGGGAYVLLELLWRGRSHVSMFGAGGACFLLLGRLDREPLPLPARAAVGAGVITAVELGTGLLVNRDHRIWDYRGVPGNVAGQICPLFTALWVPVSLTGMGLYRWLDRKTQA